MVEGVFDAMTGVGIVKHDFSIADVALDIELPKYGRTGPVFGCTYIIGVDEMGDCGGIEEGGKEGDEMVSCVFYQGMLEDGVRNMALGRGI
jgi:hypothetical protein